MSSLYNTPKIMLSYSHEDTNIAESIVKSNQLADLNIWYDHRGLKLGQEWDTAISNVLADCDIVIALLSSNYFKSDNCQDELSYARNKQKTILLIYIEENVIIPEWFDLRFHRLHAIYQYNYANQELFYTELRQNLMTSLYPSPSDFPIVELRPSKSSSSNSYSRLVIGLSFSCLLLVFLIGGFLVYRQISKKGTAKVLENIPTEITETSLQEASTSSEEYKLKTGTYVTTKDTNLTNISIYSNPGDINHISEIPEGKCCQLLESTSFENEMWAYIDYFGLKGWVNSSYLNYISTEPYYFQIDEDPNKNIIFVNSETLNFKKAPDSNSSTLKKLDYGTELEATSIENGWIQCVDNSGTSGYVNALYISYYSTKYWRIDIADGNNDSIKLRKKPSENEDVLDYIPEGQIVEIKTFDHGWGKITFKNQQGWIKLHYASSCAKEAK